MTASPRSRRFPAPLLAAASIALAACQTPGAPPTGSALEPEIHFSRLVPDLADRAAAQLAAAVLVSDRELAARALHRLESIETILLAAEEPPTGLGPVAADLANAMLDDSRHYRDATRELLEQDDLDLVLRARLERVARDDPLTLARARMRERSVLALGRAFNAIVEPVGRSLMSVPLAPYRLANSAIQYLTHLLTTPVIGLQERQALEHWRRFVARYPDAPESADLHRRIRRSQTRLRKLHRDRATHRADRALDAGDWRVALFYANRALHHVPEDGPASKIRKRAAEGLLAERESLRRSVSSLALAGSSVAPPDSLDLARALLLPTADLKAPVRTRVEVDPKGPLADEARFASAIQRGEAGDESGMWKDLGALAALDERDANMARHAAALVHDPTRNSHAAFRRARWRQRWDLARWVMMGAWYRGAPDRGLPKSVEWLLGLPSIVQSIATAPIRLLQLPFDRPEAGRAAPIHARRYLAQRPRGEHSDELRGWLETFEEDRENWLGALAIAEGRRDLDPVRRQELRDKASEQALAIAQRESRRDLRNGKLARVAQEFPETDAGAAAGRLFRSDAEEATPVHIRLSRGFLTENSQLAGPQGLGLRPGLLDGNPANGEIHPEGVTLLGGRVLEISLVPASGDDNDPPTHLRETISEDRLARLVSLLEETSFRNQLLDSGEILGADAQRDVYFERARLGLADSIDPRAASESRYVYEGIRERYGMVRGRESILPFDLVLQGSLADLSLGAFPRIRPPRETPDAFLYK